MNNPIRKVMIKDLPEELLDTIMEQITPYSIGLLKVYRNGMSEKVNLMGSGTLIQVDGKYGILTAHHVASVLNNERDNFTQLGLTILPYEHKFVVDRRFLGIMEVGKPQKGFECPDLAVIILPQVDVEWIRVYKLFWNVPRWRQDILSKPPDPNMGLWFICGFPSAWIRKGGSTERFGKVDSYGGMCGYSGIERYYAEREFDYFKVSVNPKEVGLPETFGGVSGGGLWHVLLTQADDGTYQFDNPILSGVAFLEDYNETMRRIISITCHDWRSIYEEVYNAVLRECP